MGDYLRGDLRVGFEPWQLLTSAFLHGGTFAHIAFNMFALFVRHVVERAVGSRRFAVAVLGLGAFRRLVQLLVVTPR